MCRHSIEARTLNVRVIPLIQDALRATDAYNRPKDSKASTDFSLIRYLVPFVQKYEGWAIFCDCDFLFTDSLDMLFELRDDSKAVMVVKHEYTPAEKIKMDKKRQHVYHRKNWSSLMLFNCSHPSNRGLTPALVDTSDPGYLHRFGWLHDEEIGELPVDWNYLAGVYPKYVGAYPPSGIHYTLGGPWMPGYENGDYAELWGDELKRMKGIE